MSNSVELQTVGRRSVLRSAGGLAAGALVGGWSHAVRAKGGRKRYVIVGMGSRSRMYTEAITETFRNTSELVGLCDTNPGRLQLAARTVARQAAHPKTYAAEHFDAMLAELRPDVVIVTTPDATHDDYIVRALDAGCDAITEKPLTTTAAKAQRILDACKRNAKHVRVLFNYRYSPSRTQVKDLLMGGAIGDVLSVDFTWLLNTLHGADYFRRWHSTKSISGGLMVHKATHHFDLVNWWLGSEPQRVLAHGKREFYTPAMARRMGLSGPHTRCSTCPEAKRCTFHLDIAADPAFKALYVDNEKYDGYFRDRCVFRPEIDIEDTMNVIVQYATGATMSYSLNACNAWEGYRIAFNGTKGRLEHEIVEQAFAAGATLPPGAEKNTIATRLIPFRGPVQTIQPWTGKGGHGGGDAVMLREVFGQSRQDKYRRVADERSGLYSILVGAAANESFSTGTSVDVSKMVHGLTPPDKAPMPTRRDKVPMPRRA